MTLQKVLVLFSELLFFSLSRRGHLLVYVLRIKHARLQDWLEREHVHSEEAVLPETRVAQSHHDVHSAEMVRTRAHQKAGHEVGVCYSQKVITSMRILMSSIFHTSARLGLAEWQMSGCHEC